MMSQTTKYSIDRAERQTVHVESIVEVREHAEALWEAGTSPTHDFDNRANQRSEEKFVKDRIEGKVGEHAFSLFLEELGFDAQVDYDIYDSEEQTDYADLKTIQGERPACRFDVKTTKKDNLWLAIREAIYHQHEETDPFILTLVDPEEVHDPPFDVELVGWVEKQDIPYRVERGSKMFLPWNKHAKIGPPLKTDNWMVPVDDVEEANEKQWRTFVETRLTA